MFYMNQEIWNHIELLIMSSQLTLDLLVGPFGRVLYFLNLLSFTENLNGALRQL